MNSNQFLLTVNKHRRTPPPLVLLARCRRPKVRITLPRNWPAVDVAQRSYLRELRAAELAAWQASGGDFVRADALPAIRASRAA